ncbi:MAG TPA: metalloregulator ArsR/SmtB family transcription factor [Acidimicrobiales bacterium]|nr:metalloregulator ArsR/SmtB family transcription factor [Acidimicrobiales bacterium]
MTIDVGTLHVAEVLKALAEPRRWEIVELLSCEELCVCHLAEHLGIAQPLVSHHLRVLREAGLVESERHRQWTYYRLRTGVLEDLGERIAAITSCCPIPGERRRPCA